MENIGLINQLIRGEIMKIKLNQNVFDTFCDKILKNEDENKKQFWYDPKNEKCYYTNGEKPSKNAICIVENINNPEWRLDKICHDCSSTQKECEERQSLGWS